VTQFLYDLRRRVGNKLTILDLPLEILMNYVRLQGTGDVTFLVSGQLKYSRLCYIYEVKPKGKTVSLIHDACNYGASYRGMTDMAHAIMSSGIDYATLSIDSAIDLTKTCLCTNLTVYKYNRKQVVGGQCQVYVIDMLHNQ